MSIAEKLQTIAENEQKVFEAGKQAEKKAFWDNFFNNGKRKSFRGAFGSCFDAELLKDVPYTITPIKAYTQDVPAFNMFYHTNRDNDSNSSKRVDISHIKFDFTKVNSYASGATGCKLSQVFYNAGVNNVVMDLTGVTSVDMLFWYANSSKGKPNKITLKVTESLIKYSNPFYALSVENLDIRFTEDSVIVASIAFTDNTNLIVESAINIINTLKNFAGTDKELANKLTFPVAVWNRLEASGITPPSGSTWKDYVNLKGWAYA